jgi:predicted DNA-binding transcriptional regulator AlpA
MIENPRSYPPDYVNAETLAYLLDCSKSSIDGWVKAGVLPKPYMLGITGKTPRWSRTEVDAAIKEKAYSGADRPLTNFEALAKYVKTTKKRRVTT